MKEHPMTWILVNIPLMVVFVALWVGIPVWLVLRHPDGASRRAPAAAVSYLIRRAEPARDGAAAYRRVA
jgi:hypothetical protein